MTGLALAIERLAGSHDRASFSCGVESLDQYLRQQACQDIRRDLSICYVLCERDSPSILGYYTLSAHSIEPSALAAEQLRRLPRYPTIPAVLLGRLAVDSRLRGRRYGELLLVDALQRTLQTGVGTFAVVVDAIDEAAAQFYERFGFTRFADSPSRLYIATRTIRELFPGA